MKGQAGMRLKFRPRVLTPLYSSLSYSLLSHSSSTTISTPSLSLSLHSILFFSSLRPKTFRFCIKAKMYAREKLCRDQCHKSSRKTDTNPPSFSSTLLDEIYRSIDEKSDDLNGYKGTASSRRACLVEKWMEKEANEIAAARKLRSHQFLQESDTKSAHDSDVIFFSSTSSSSDSSGALSSSDTEFFGSTGRSKPPKVSCFTTGRPKPVRTGARSDPDRFTGVVGDDLIKSKSRALRIYANLKKVKQPISPGGRLTSFINSLFSSASGKKPRNLEPRDEKPASGPSTASSFSRSCLSKYSPRSREKMRDGERRTVRFQPVSGDLDLRPSGHKSVYSGDSGRFGRPPLPPTELKKVEVVAPRQNNYSNITKRSGVFYNVDEDEEFDEEDCLSDSSSDLFELDHLALFGSNRYREELPVYETTHFDTNCAIASGLIR